ncbi:unnamed protein product, partial [Ectocarpus sp. 12 AP-2014]
MAGTGNITGCFAFDAFLSGRLCQRMNSSELPRHVLSLVFVCAPVCRECRTKVFWESRARARGVVGTAPQQQQAADDAVVCSRNGYARVHLAPALLRTSITLVLGEAG